MKFLLAFTSVFIFSLSHAQWNWPVQVNTVTTGPYYNYLSYYADQNDHMQVMVTLTDPNATSVPAKLHVRIEGPGYWLETKPFNNIPPLTLEPFTPNIISGIQLAPYFYEGNLNKSSDQLDVNNLPEGLTNVCVEVIGVGGTLTTIGGTQCAPFWLQRFQPPQQTLPLCESTIDTTELFHIFQWTPPIGYVPTLTSELSYTFSLYEWVDPNNYTIFQTGQGLVYQQTTNVPMLQVSDFDVQLQNGMDYVWRVQASMSDNGMQINMFENNGLSEICTFTFGQSQSLEEALTDGLYIDLNAEASTSFKGRAYWTVLDNTPGQGLSTYDRYLVEYRKKPDSEHPNPTWFYDTVPSFNHFIYQLGPGNTYEVRVSGIAGTFVSDPSNTVEFTTPPPIDYSCGDPQMPYRPPSFTPNENVLAGNQVQIGQFLMTLSEVTPTGALGHYKGKGTVPIQFLSGAKAKVRFEDILIDNEFIVREGRVDVITEGLENWLHEQYMQFVDPIYVDGTVDSAWVDTTAGVAWAVVDGVSQQFTFDPPDYPIIINDESGYQWTIWPDGTVTVEGYLDPSEQWAVTADEVAIFAQNSNETFGFDPKEHMQWHANYEVIQLTGGQDSSYYFVANKSIGKGQTDVVDATLPSGVTPTFKLDDQTNVTATASGNVYTLQLPSIQQTGEHPIYVYDGSTRIGKLNLYVYAPKERDVVIVPIANVSVDTAQLQQTLRQTLGEANLTFNLSLEAQWNDPVFTPSKTIALPQEVGLMNKYSQDMRDLRDAYVEAHPDAPKNKYYLFVVPGFDDAATDGYMVRGKSLGFVVGNDYLTYAHELGHGIGALEHSWKNNGPPQGGTTNLMDYSSLPTGEAPNNLTKAQWKELRDVDLAPSLWDEIEDAEMLNSTFILAEDIDPTIQDAGYGDDGFVYVQKSLVANSNGVIKIKLDQDHYLRIPDASFFDELIFRNGKFVGFMYNYQGEMHQSIIHKSRIAQDIALGTDRKRYAQNIAYMYSFKCNELNCRPDNHYGKVIHNGVEHTVIDIPGIHDPGVGDELFELNCEYAHDFVVVGWDGSAPVFETTEPCVTENTMCDNLAEYESIQSNHIDWVADGIHHAIQYGFNYNDNDSRPIYQIEQGGFTRYLRFEYENADQISDRFKLLNHYRSNTYVVQLFLKVGDYKKYSTNQVKSLAYQALQKYELDHPGKEDVVLLLTTHAEIPSAFGIFKKSLGTCVNMSYAASDNLLVGNTFDEMEFDQLQSVGDATMYLFKHLNKPYHITSLYYHLNGDITTTVNENLYNPSQDRSGIPFIIGANLYKSKRWATVESMQSTASENAMEDAEDYDDNPTAVALTFDTTPWEEINAYKEANSHLDNLNTRAHWDVVEVNWLKYRERYLKNKKLLTQIMDDEISGCKYCSNFSIVIGKSNVSPYHLHNFDPYALVIDPLFYGALDILGMIPGIDIFADGAGIVYATLRGDAVNFAVYSAALATPLVGAYAYKKVAYYVRKTGNSYEMMAKSSDDVLDGWYRMSNETNVQVDQLSAAKTDLNGIRKPSVSQNELKKAYDVASGVDGWLSSNLLTKLDDLNDALLKQKFIDDFAGATAETKTLLNQSPELVDSWKALDNAGVDDALRKNTGALEALSQPKFSRDLPETYLDADYITTHLNKFDGGVTKFVSDAPTGAVGPPSGTFVLPKSQADNLIAQAGGDVNKLEDLLGLDRGTLGTNPIRLDVENPSGLRMPSGNELGANEKWIPGGKTSGGILEATVDQIQPGTFVPTPAF